MIFRFSLSSYLFFFFSSRRRHTRFKCDWSSDVCSSDLYRFVRHPLMLGLFIAIWAQPIMPPELLMMNAGMTIYILGAIVLEEHDLVRQYGEEYEKYQRAVPSLIPWKWW